ncbi:MAG: hypothetical protein ACPGO5_05345 [Patescibacteria group bacterium]
MSTLFANPETRRLRLKIVFVVLSLLASFILYGIYSHDWWAERVNPFIMSVTTGTGATFVFFYLIYFKSHLGYYSLLFTHRLRDLSIKIHDADITIVHTYPGSGSFYTVQVDPTYANYIVDEGKRKNREIPLKDGTKLLLTLDAAHHWLEVTTKEK